MTIIDQLREERSMQRRVSDFREPAVEVVNCEKTEEIREHTLDLSEEYRLSATVSVTFWANRAQYSRSRQMAERVLLDRLYGDTLALLNEAEKGVYDGDAKAVFAAIREIRKNLVGGN